MNKLNVKNRAPEGIASLTDYFSHKHEGQWVEVADGTDYGEVRYIGMIAQTDGGVFKLISFDGNRTFDGPKAGNVRVVRLFDAEINLTERIG